MKGRPALAALIALLIIAPSLGAQSGRADSLYVHVAGSGTPVVIVPGMLGSAYGFRKVIPSLVSDDFRVAVIDPLGYGASARPDNADYSFSAQAARVSAAITRLGMHKVILVCHALSGPICLRMTYAHPELVKSIVSINGGASDEGGSTEMRVAIKLARVVLFVMGRNFAYERVRKGLIEASADGGWVSDSVLANYVAPFGSDVRKVMRALQQIVDAHEPVKLAQELPRVQAPILLLYGTTTHNPKDAALSVQERIALRTGIRRFEEKDVARAGVYIQEEQPARVIDAIKKMRNVSN